MGREHELDALRSAWHASDPDGQVILLEGEAGIGKTRLAEVFAAGVREEAGIVLAGRGYPGEGAIAYGPIAETPASRPRLARRTAPAGCARRDRAGGPRPPCRAPGADPAGVWRPVHRAGRSRGTGPVARGHRRRAHGSRLRACPGLVWIDDVHLVDDATREAVAYLARRLRGRPLLLLVALRREDLTAGGETMVADLARLPVAASLVLGRLSRDAIADLVRAVRPGDARDDALIDAFAGDSEGSAAPCRRRARER